MIQINSDWTGINRIKSDWIASNEITTSTIIFKHIKNIYLKKSSINTGVLNPIESELFRNILQIHSELIRKKIWIWFDANWVKINSTQSDPFRSNPRL